MAGPRIDLPWPEVPTSATVAEGLIRRDSPRSTGVSGRVSYLATGGALTQICDSAQQCDWIE